MQITDDLPTPPVQMSCILHTETTSHCVDKNTEMTELAGYRCYCSAKDFPKQVTSGWPIK